MKGSVVVFLQHAVAFEWTPSLCLSYSVGLMTIKTSRGCQGDVLVIARSFYPAEGDSADPRAGAGLEHDKSLHTNFTGDHDGPLIHATPATVKDNNLLFRTEYMKARETHV